MFNYLTVTENRLLVVSNTKILQFDNQLTLINTIEAKKEPITYLFDHFYHTNKRLFDLNTQKELFDVKGLTKIVKIDQTFYAATRFGDVYRQNDLLFGNMCYTTDIVEHNGAIVISDKYGRLKYTDKCGNILKFEFFDKKPIVSILSHKGILVVNLLNEIIVGEKRIVFKIDENMKIYKMIEFNDNVVAIGDDSFIFNIEKDKIKVLTKFGSVKDAVIYNDEVVYINDNNELKVNERVIRKLDGDFPNYLNHLFKD